MNFESFMINAPKVLFNLGWALAILVFLVTFFPVLIHGRGDAIVTGLGTGFVAAIVAALGPWIAAAVLWRVDKYLEARK